MKNFMTGLVAICITGFMACSPDLAIPENPNTPNVAPTPVATTAAITCPEGTELDSIPSVVANYLSANHDGVSIDEISLLDDNGAVNYGVELDDGIQLLLDADGNLVAEGMENEIDLSIDSLSAAITTYVADNFPGAAITEAEQEGKYGTSYIEVELDNGMSLIFDVDGNYLCSEEEDETEDNDDDETEGDNDDDETEGDNDDDETEGDNDDDETEGDNDDDETEEDNDDDETEEDNDDDDETEEDNDDDETEGEDDDDN